MLLDDPLSAVDGKVGKTIFKHAVSKFVETGGNSTVVMALNQMQFLPSFDYIIMLEEGQIYAQGTYPELMASSDAFNEMVQGKRRRQRASSELRASSPRRTSHSVFDNVSRNSCSSVTGERDRLSQNQEQEAHVLVQTETKKQGALAGGVLMKFLRGMGLTWFSLTVLVSVICYGVMVLTDRWFARWITLSAAPVFQGHGYYTGIYGAGCLIFGVCLVGTSMLFQTGSVRASRSLHHDCLDKLMHAPVSWHEETPSGRILSRFSSDLNQLDFTIPVFFDTFVQFTCTLTAFVALVCVLVPKITFVMAIALGVFSINTIGSFAACVCISVHCICFASISTV